MLELILLGCVQNTINSLEPDITATTVPEQTQLDQEECATAEVYIVPPRDTCVNILVVVDKSWSMAYYWHKVQPFLEKVTNEIFPKYSNAKYVIITADPNEENYNAPINPASYTNTGWNLGFPQQEKGLEAATTYIASNNGIWIDDQCDLSLILISDEADKSHEDLTREETLELFREEISEVVDLTSVYMTTIYLTNPDTTSQACPVLEEEIEYMYPLLPEYFTTITNDLCSNPESWQVYDDQDWGPIPVTDISWPLSYVPIEDSIKLYVGDQLTDAFSFSDGTIYYDGSLYPNQKITTSYRVDIAGYTSTTGDDCPVPEEERLK
jgi:hypothetical protein